MKPIHLKLFVIIIFSSALSAQEEVISTKNTQSGQCTGGGNLGFVASELPGASGQGNTDPRSEFENHAIVKYNGKYYDPSYGSSIANDANSWETPALDGFGSILRYIDVLKEKDFYLNWVGYINNTTQQSNVNH